MTYSNYDTLKDTTINLFEYCRKNKWAGFDPYDALNSKIFISLPFLDFKLFRLALTQVLKRSPINVRQMLLIPETRNPKAIALFLKAFIKLSGLGLLNEKVFIKKMIDALIALRSPGTPYWCWGYSFPWQGRTILVPRAEPNLVCTSFVADALLDAYETLKDPRLIEMAVSSSEYILNELYWESGESTAGFSYPMPGLKSRTHNANFLGAAVLCRAYKISGEKKFLEPAMKVVRYSAKEQRDDGSWDYAESSNYRWIDNFHTGYNLCALRTISNSADTEEFESHTRRGYAFYRHHFFREDGAARYFHNRTYPIDIHSVAQSIITLLAFKEMDQSNVNLAHAVFRWARNNMMDPKGYFYYQITPYYRNRISYMRWSQAWMFLALTDLIKQDSCND